MMSNFGYLMDVR